jgi:hypothetical protein
MGAASHLDSFGVFVDGHEYVCNQQMPYAEKEMLLSIPSGALEFIAPILIGVDHAFFTEIS